MPRPFLTAEWRDVAVLNFEIDPELINALLKPWIPQSTELDLWNGVALVSLVGFRFLDTRVLGAAIPFHRDFDEVNLRFYVRPKGADARPASGDADTRGVVFIREFVPKRAVSLVANALYGEHYATARMEHTIERSSPQAGVSRTCASYAWQWRGRKSFLAVEAEGDPKLPEPGSADAFIFEHYWGYGASTYRVEHPPWRTYSVTSARHEVDGDAVYGAGFGEVLARAPVSAMLAEGSAVSVFRASRQPR